MNNPLTKFNTKCIKILIPTPPPKKKEEEECIETKLGL